LAFVVERCGGLSEVATSPRELRVLFTVVSQLTFFGIFGLWM